MLRRCPFGPSWWAEPQGGGVAHAEAECSNMGECERNSGICDCRSGFGGEACEKLLCPSGADGDYCSGNGVCLPMWRVAEVTQYSGIDAGLSYGAATQNPLATWDSRRVYKCVCDSRDGDQPAVGPVGLVSGVPVLNPDFVGGWTGYDCSRRRCPVGDDVHTPGVPEVQTVRCYASHPSTFTFTFRGQETRPIVANASLAAVEAALENLTTIQDVTVSATAGTRACRVGWEMADGSNGVEDGLQITFISQLGDLPMLETTPAYNVTETQRGTKESAECGNRGVCDYNTGHCQCLAGYVGSDGAGNVGTRRDCGRLDPQGFTLNLYK
jgi:hypothetical protein